MNIQKFRQVSVNLNIHNRQSNKQVFFSLEFVNILLQIEAKPVKNASSLLQFSGHSELETGLLFLGSFLETRRAAISQ